MQSPSHMKHRALLLLAPLIVPALVGCAADAEEESVAVGADAAELSTSGETYTAGTSLNVTANLNLRKTASRSAEVLRVIPSGSTVTVWKTSGESAWVAVSSAGYKGWAHTDYLEKEGTGAGAKTDDEPAGYSAARGSKLASLALRVNGRGSGGQCAKYVSNHVEDSGAVVVCTDPEGVGRTIADPNSRIVLAEQDGKLMACAHIECQPRGAYFGMFSVNPKSQGGGIGNQLIAECERIARDEWHCASVFMTVIRQRDELIAWYERRGYAKTGERKPFPYGDARFGLPKRDDLEFIVLEKKL